MGRRKRGLKKYKRAHLGEDEYTRKVAGTIEEATQLVELGFEYVTEIDNTKLFRKRK